MYDGIWGQNTLNTILWNQQYNLNNYNFLQNQYQCNSPAQSILNQQAQQCCSTADIMNRWQESSLKSQTEKLKELENSYNVSSKTIQIKTLPEEIRGGECKKIFDESISDYMDKEFLYESELKEIEDKFHFDFKSLDYNKQDDVTKSCKNLINKINEYNHDKNFKYINYLYVSKCCDSVNVKMNNRFMSVDIFLNNTDIKILRGINNNEKVESVCNTLLKAKLPEYQKFYEKYKNRIVKDNEYEDLSYYEKILEESC